MSAALRIRTFLSIVGAAIAALQLASTETASGGQRYRTERPAITIALSKEGRYLKRVRVEAAGRCSNGRKTTVSFAIIGAGAIEISRNGRFNVSRRNAHELRVLKGRVEGDVIRGYFRRFYDGNAENGFEPRCGTGSPTSRPINFVARRP